ncbi:MAG: putative A/G-specific adenine glycosylase YfhQ [Chloroflexi bacterium ADurb.Bin360]|nr:MAG: putative A/G-specific adenine glycosylase YfhQ [Chloroflexi bacterium ADurb.Bin360]
MMELSETETCYLETRRDFAQNALLSWFTAHARRLPWRENRSPYQVWVSEIMLQQTQVEMVQNYFMRFMERFPTPEALAAAPLEAVLKVWEGLGYYSRARALHRAAQKVMEHHQGRLPADPKILRTLPGIGPYTAGAIASLAFNIPVPAVDGNVRRVLARVLALPDPSPELLESIARAWLPELNPGVFNEALMELGALICRPRSPQCSVCPWRELCRAYELGQPEGFPVVKPRKPLPHYDVVAAVTMREDRRILVAQRRPEDMLGGLWEFPGGKRQEGETLETALRRELQEEMGITLEVGAPIEVVRHAYTHFRITLYAYECRLVGGEPQCIECADFKWATLDDLRTLPMAVTDRRIARTVELRLGAQED